MKRREIRDEIARLSAARYSEREDLVMVGCGLIKKITDMKRIGVVLSGGSIDSDVLVRLLTGQGRA